MGRLGRSEKNKEIERIRKARPRFKGAYLRTITDSQEIYDISWTGDSKRNTRRMVIEKTASDEFFLHECARVVREMQCGDAIQKEQSFDTYLNAYVIKRNLTANSERSFRNSLSGFSFDSAENEKRVDFIRNSGTFKQGTIRLKLKAVKAFFSFVRKQGVEIENPIPDEKIRDGEPRTRVPTQEEITLLLTSVDATGSQTDRLYVRLLADTGARGSTIELITPSDMSADWNLRLYNQKQRKKMPLRTPIVNQDTRNLWTAVCDGKGENMPLFDHLCHDRLLRRMRALFPKKDGETLSVHSLRKAFVTRMVHDGVPIDVVSQLTCTSPTILLKHYTHCTQDDINELFGVNKPEEKKKAEIECPKQLKLFRHL